VIITWTELKDARALKGWTQQELADAIGVHQKTIVNWESKGVPPKSAYKVQRVLRKELEYVEHVGSGQSTLTFDEYLEIYDQRRLADEEREEAPSAQYESDEDAAWHAQSVANYEEQQLEEQQAAYDARVALQDTLAQFDTVTLLKEIELRVRRLQAEARDQVTDRSRPTEG
jgi:DNA-binding XRE family transcriptional regulator